MSSKAALAFDASRRTATDLKKFWDADPLSAAKWVNNVGKAAQKEVPQLAKVEAILNGRGSDEFKAKKLSELARRTPTLFKVGSELGEHQAARAPTIGWAAAPADAGWREPPAFTGTLRVTDGQVKLETTRGSFDIQLAATSWRDEIETAFVDRVVTLKGYPTGDGKTLAIEQFGPGSSDDYVSGRIKVDGDKVYVSPNNNTAQQAEITDPGLKKLLMGDPAKNLANYSPAGVILPGKVEVKHGKAVYAHDAKDGFYLLGRVMAHTAKELPKGKEWHLFETGYFKMSDAISPKGLPIPASSAVDAKVGPEGDATIGSTKAGEGRRTFFWVKILSPEAKVDGVDLTNQRRFEVTWMGQAGDVGHHSAVGADAFAKNLKEVAQAVPAAVKGADVPFAPADAARFKKT